MIPRPTALTLSDGTIVELYDDDSVSIRLAPPSTALFQFDRSGELVAGRHTAANIGEATRERARAEHVYRSIFLDTDERIH
jgi:hypothetical protein